MTGYRHGHVAASGSFIVCVDDFPILQNADSCCTAANVHNRSVTNLKYSRCGSWFIYNISHLKAGTLQHIAYALNAPL